MKSIVITILGLVCFSVTAQVTQTIRGTVIDQDLRIPLPGATIRLLDTGEDLVGTTTGADGEFTLHSVEIGRRSIQVSYLGYQEQTISDILVIAGKQVVLEIGMVEAIANLAEIIVDGDEKKELPINQMAAVSSRMFTVEETKRYAGSIDDPARMALSYAGVAFDDDIENSLVIRGNSPRGMLWRMEGIDIPNPNHFADLGSSGGGISMLSSNMMTNSDFVTGAFPAEYGNATSGVFDINLRKGNNEEREYAFQFGVLGTDFSLEGPFNNRYDGSYLVNYRYSTLSLLNNLGFDVVGDAIPRYQDLSFKIWLPTEQGGNFSLFGLGGTSFIKEDWTSPASNFDDEAGYENGIIGISHNMLLSEKSYLKSVFAWTYSNVLYDQWETPGSSNVRNKIFDEDYVNQSQKLSVTYNHKFDSRVFMRLGTIATRLSFDYHASSSQTGGDQLVTNLDVNGRSWQLQVFSSWKFRLNNYLALHGGFHFTSFRYNNSQSLEPRLAISWDISEKQRLSAGLGMHTKVQDLSLYSAQDRTPGSVTQPNRDLEFGKALHAVAGYDRRVGANIHLKAEIYYQHLYHVPVWPEPHAYESSLNVNDGYTTFKLLNEGKGRNYGLEITLEKFFSNQNYFLVTGSLYESKYIPLDGIERDSRYNGNYKLNALAGKEFITGDAKRNRFGLSSRVMLAGGKRFTPVLLEESRQKGYTVRDDHSTYSEKADDYFRIDLQAYYRIERFKTTHMIKLDVQNILNRLNVYDKYYSSFTGNIETSTLTGMIPVLSYKISF